MKARGTLLCDELEAICPLPLAIGGRMRVIEADAEASPHKNTLGQCQAFFPLIAQLSA